MQIITLLSDWGLKDHYVASVKGVIYKMLPEVTLIDLSHQVRPYDYDEAGFILKSAYPNFPEGTVHIIGVNEIASTENPHLAVKYRGQYFIGADSRIFQRVIEEKPDSIIELEVYSDSSYYTFPTRDVFAKCAVQIINGKPLEEMGVKYTKMDTWLMIHPQASSDTINGAVIYIDSFENSVTNIDIDLYRKVSKGRKPHILVNSYELFEIQQSYTDVENNEMLALFGSHGQLEISMCHYASASLVGISVGTPVRISFE